MHTHIHSQHTHTHNRTKALPTLLTPSTEHCGGWGKWAVLRWTNSNIFCCPWPVKGARLGKKCCHAILPLWLRIPYTWGTQVMEVYTITAITLTYYHADIDCFQPLHSAGMGRTIVEWGWQALLTQSLPLHYHADNCLFQPLRSAGTACTIAEWGWQALFTRSLPLQYHVGISFFQPLHSAGRGCTIVEWRWQALLTQ